MRSSTSGRAAACVTVLASLLIFLYPLASRIRRRNQETRPSGIQTICEPDDAKFEIVAVHGLGAHPEYTWTRDAHSPGGGPKRKIHLLRDLLHGSFPQARIVSFAHNSDWLIDAPVQTMQQIGQKLHDQLVEHRKSKKRLPIIFMGHSFGGIIIKQALYLCMTSEVQQEQIAEQIIHDTSGILFLGTPHQGSRMSFPGSILARVTGLLGSSTGLLFTLRHNSNDLSDLESSFDKVRGRLQGAKIYSIYEKKPSYLLGFSLGLFVDRNSARGPADKTFDVDTDHTGLNKCSKDSDGAYQAIHKAIEELRQRPSLLELGDERIRHSYTADKLKIERISGSQLSMSQCYINLAIIEQNLQTGRTADEYGRPQFRTSLLERLNIEEPNKDLHVNLPNLFEPRRIDAQETVQPRRILIRGRPGVGKTTLCKKIVHDFIDPGCRLWRDRFTRLLWIPLRKLQDRQGGYKLTDLLDDEFFSQYERDKDSESIISELARECWNRGAGSSLFLLDGLDEIQQHLSRDSPIYEFVQRLLNQPNVIVTSRPSVQLLGDFKPFDLELETIGFYPDQVIEYIRQVADLVENGDTNIDKKSGEKKSQKIISFLDQHPLVGDLVRIPIQLDALCFAWDDKSHEKTETMTELYQAMEIGLWRKDLRRPGGIASGKPHHYMGSSPAELYPAELEKRVKDEAILLEKLAFAGLCNGYTVFDAGIISALSDSDYLTMPKGKFIDQTLRHLSFLRSTDVSPLDLSRHYNFLHLTLQEYFAARYLKRMWVEGKDFKLPGTKESLNATTFLHRYKYHEKFDIVWRFMAGLLASNADQKTRYFQTIQEPPLDLLGPTHQRLLMHCLYEVPFSNDALRKQIEDQLPAWLTFEYDVRKLDALAVYLAREMEFPMGALSKLLKESEVGLKMCLLRSIYARRVISVEILQLALSWLESSPSRELVQEVLRYFENVIEPLLNGGLRVTEQRLGGEDSNVQQATIEVKNRLYLTEAILQAVVGRVNDEDSRISAMALQILEKRPSLPESIPQTVLEWVNNKTHDVRWAAIRILEKQSKLPVWVPQAATREFNHEDSSIREAAVRTLTWGAEDYPEWLCQLVAERLDDKDTRVREVAIEFFSKSPIPESIHQAIVEKLTNKNSDVREAAARALVRKHLPKRRLQAVAERTNGEGSGVRKAATEALGKLSDLPAVLLQAVAEMINDEDPGVWSVAIKALGEQSDLPEGILQAVAERIYGEDSGFRKATIEALEKQSNLPESILQAVAERINDEDPGVRRAATEALGKLSDPPEWILQAVAERMNDEDSGFRKTIIEALGKLSDLPEGILQAVAERINDKDSGIRRAATRALEEQSNLPEGILQAVAERINGENLAVQRAATRALEEQSNLPEGILQAVVERINGENLAVQRAATRAPEEQSNLPEGILQAVAERINGENLAVQRAARRAPEEQSNLPERVLPAVAESFTDEDYEVQRAALSLLKDRSNLSDYALGSLSLIFKQGSPSNLDWVRTELLSMIKQYPKLIAAILDDHDCFKGLAHFLLRQSFRRHLVWYHYNNKLHLVIGGDVISYEGEDPSDIISQIAPSRPGCGPGGLSNNTYRELPKQQIMGRPASGERWGNDSDDSDGSDNCDDWDDSDGYTATRFDRYGVRENDELLSDVRQGIEGGFMRRMNDYFCI